MKFYYYKDTDSLYIDLKHTPGTDSREVAPGIVMDFDAKGQVVGIDIDRASKIVNLSTLETKGISYPIGTSTG